MARASKLGHLPLYAGGPIDCALGGASLLATPYLNKGSAFPPDERRAFGLTGLLPANVQTLEQQVRRAYAQYSSRADDLAKNTFLTSLKDQNEVLYYRLLLDNLKEMFSVVYTPTEAEAISNYGHLFRKPEGCFLNIDDPDRVYEDLAQWGTADDIDYIVVTDGEEILGIGDQGVGGILISVAKLVLTTLCAGTHPNRCLPVVLDCGTDNQDLLDDDLYLGLRKRRVRGARYEEFVDRAVQAVRKLYPRAYLHFEDFGLSNARRFLDKYRGTLPCFNDDVQGTGCVTLAAIMAGLHVARKRLGDVKMVVFGAGSAGVGIADQVRDAIAAEADITHEEAAKQIWLVDKPGLLTTDTDTSDAQKAFTKDGADWRDKETDLLSVVQNVRPDVLIGTSTVPGAFTEAIVRAMASHAPRPIILPLSNPTRLHEATPADLLAWTDGKALVATGSPFDPVTGPWGEGGHDDNGNNGDEGDAKKGGQGGKEDITVQIAECNNSVVFPGIGLGCVLSRARLLTDRMLVAAVEGVASLSPAKDDPRAPLLPDVGDVRRVSMRVARRVILAAVEDGVAQEEGIPEAGAPATSRNSNEGSNGSDGGDAGDDENNSGSGSSGGDGDGDELDEWIAAQMWTPEYRPLRSVSMEGASRAARGEMRMAGTVNRMGEL